MKIKVTEAARRFSDLLNRVFYKGEVFELQRGKKVIARLGPARNASPVRASDLPALFRELPDLANDAESFARDVESASSMAGTETDPWT